MKTSSRGLAEIAQAVILWCLPVSLSATGFRLPDQDAFATARGEAFVATADNPSAIYYNPAGITQLRGHNFRAGLYGIDLEPSYKAPSGEEFGNQSKLHAVPQLYYVEGLEDSPLNFGLGAYSPYGLGLRWPQDTGFRTVGTEATLSYMTLNPVVGWRVLPNFSVGAGLTLNYSKVDLRQGLIWPAQHFDEFRFKGDGYDFGYNLGLLWKTSEKVQIGVSFRSTTDVRMQGHTFYYNSVPFPPPPNAPAVPAFPRQRVEAEADLPFPLNAAFGVSYRPSPDWNFEFNADYNGWERVQSLTIRQAAAFPPLLPENLPLVLDWQSSWYYEFGATRYLKNGWSISAGYIFNENALPDAHYTPLVSDQDRHFFSVGTGYRGKRFDFDVAYQFGYGPDRSVNGSGFSPTGQTADGRYAFLSHAVALSIGWHF